MQNQEHPKESGKNLGFYAASGICLLTLVAAIGVGISGLGKESANEAQVSVAEETEPTGAATSDLTVSEEEDETSEQNVVTIGGGLDTSSEETEETFASEEAEETATESQPDPAPSFALPVEGEILTEYSDGELVKNETLGEWRTHDGIDIAAAANTPVKAAADGT